MEAAPRVILTGGEYDVYSLDVLERELEPLAPGNAVVDLANVRYLDTMSLGCLVKVLKRLREQNPDSTITLLHANPNIRRVLDVTQLSNLFNVD